jgi:putative endopeptidase
MKKSKAYAVVFISVFLLTGYLSVLNAQKSSVSSSHGIISANLDRSVAPGDDFFKYTNGGWIKRTEIPADRAAVDVFDSLSDIADTRVQTIIKEIAESKSPVDSGSRKIADLYNSYMDEATVEKRGLEPLRAQMDAIQAISDKRELARALGEGLRADVDPLNDTNFHTANLFGLWVAGAFDDPDHYTAYLLQGGLVLPDREYYLASDAHSVEVRAKYQTHVAAMLNLAGLSDASNRAARIIELEHAIAEKHTSLADSQDLHKANNVWTQADFSAKAPGLNWSEYFRAAGLSNQAHFVVWQPSAFTGESALVASVPLDTWKDWLTFHLLEHYAAVLPKAFVDERFAFMGKTLQGTEQLRPRWQRGITLVNDLLGDAVGQIYAKRYFSPQAKAQAQTMVSNVVVAFQKRIDALTWMAPATKAEAKAKLAALYIGIGYPESWRDYSQYEVKADDLAGNLQRADLFEYHRQVARLGGNVDRHEWQMTPQTVNAVNLPLQIALNFPAAILQPPFFDPEAPAASNYGSMGAIIGHEISHTFDSEGSAIDATGRLRNWWTDADFAHFNTATARLVEQYNGYKPFPDLAINGKQTLAENIADLGGLCASFDGYHASLNGKPAQARDGFTGDQQFLIAFGQSWGGKVRESMLRMQVLTNEHSPGEYRADMVRNLDAWYSAFSVQSKDKLFLAPTDRVRIW